MKKALSLILAMLMCVTILAGCTTLEEGDKGAIIDMYLTTEDIDFLRLCNSPQATHAQLSQYSQVQNPSKLQHYKNDPDLQSYGCRSFLF